MQGAKDKGIWRRSGGSRWDRECLMNQEANVSWMQQQRLRLIWAWWALVAGLEMLQRIGIPNSSLSHIA